MSFACIFRDGIGGASLGDPVHPEVGGVAWSAGFSPLQRAKGWSGGMDRDAPEFSSRNGVNASTLYTSLTSDFSQSQRDCVPKPSNGVARNELPWESAWKRASTPKGLWLLMATTKPQPRWGWRVVARLTQGSSCLATLGLKSESLWDSQIGSNAMCIMSR